MSWLSTLRALDVRGFYSLYGTNGHPVITMVMIALTLLGSGWTLFFLLPALVYVRTRRMALVLLGTVATTAALVFVLKRLVNRSRPFATLPGVRPLFGYASDYSFPSGHSAGTFTVACFLVTVLVATWKTRANGATPWLLSRIGSGILVVMAVGIAASRVYLGFHFPADVAAGAFVGGIVGTCGGRIFLQRQGLAYATGDDQE